MKRIGILGGTFDPPHIGHLMIGEEVYDRLHLDEIWYIPTYVPPHKETDTTASSHRLKMVELSIAGNEHFHINTIELERKGKSYTADTIRLLKEHYPTNEYYFIIGGDMVEYLPNWHKIDELVEMVQFVGVKREGYSLKSPYPIIELQLPVIEVSSSQLRERLIAGKMVRYWIRDNVMNYIREKGLYGFK